ncbi:MAG: hypothetical protein DRJ51_00025 [Thermoprotei archaeon]|nr:MAG: hypothetical protein DRJ51_00025 [Thermoprotei archaeon]RLF03511.1 MAG: hypothetical protein DRJ59_00355 [Thermoprotei archaeon]
MGSDVTEETLRHLLENTIRYNLSKESYEFLKTFLGWLANQGLRVSTRYRYAEIIGDFLRWLETRNVKVERISLKDVEFYFSAVRERGLKTSTMHWYVVGIKKLLKYLYFLTDDDRYRKLYEKVKVPKIQQVLPEVLSSVEVLRLLEALDDAKYRALFSLIYETGCRISEALNLKMKDLSVDEYGIKVFFRRSKSEARAVRVIVFSKTILGWLELHAAKNDPEAYVFYGRDPYKRMARSTATYVLKRAAMKAGIKKKVHPHLLRHTRATELYRFFKELEMMRWFGWKTRKMIDIYSKITQEDVEEKYIRKFLGGEKVSHDRQLLSVAICPKCKAINPPNAKYCYSCGHSLNQS